MATPIEEITHEQFWLGLVQKAAHERVPVEAMVELTYGCNLRCVHCYNPTHQAAGELDTARFFRLIDELAAVGCLQVGFTGGEALTRRDCLEIMTYAREKGFAVSLLTNATLITPEGADRIQALHPKRVEVSIYGATAETYERVTQVPGSFARFANGVRLLRDRRVPVLIKMPVMTLNAEEVEQARALVASWGIEFVYCAEIFPRVDGCREPLQFRLSPEDVVRITRQMGGYQKWKAEGGGEQEQGCEGSPNGLFTCKCGRTSLAITPYGQMNLCVSLPTPKYDLTAGTVAEGWRQLVEFVNRANDSPGPAYECPRCDLRNGCRQGPMNAWLETTDLSPCLPYFKELAALERQATQDAGKAPGKLPHP
jgi:radical SAM protein with 4Fe4S-binding SPASM domain